MSIAVHEFMDYSSYTLDARGCGIVLVMVLDQC